MGYKTAPDFSEHLKKFISNFEYGVCDEAFKKHLSFDSFRLESRRSPFKITVAFLEGGDWQPKAEFTLQEMPGCCGVLISTRTAVSRDHRGKGIAQILQELKASLAREFGYTTLMATVRMDNPAEIHILDKFGWTKLKEFTNKRTNNLVGIYTKEV